jgi:hypothetical protein
MFSELCDQFWSGKEPTKAYSDVLPPSASPKAVVKPCLESNVKKIKTAANPIFKALGLLMFFGAMCVLKTYSLIDPVITTEMTRLVFLCVVALILQKSSNHDYNYRDEIVSSVLKA